MPAQYGFGFDDQKRVALMCPTHCRPEEGEDGAVGVGELWSVDLTLQDQELMSEGKDFCVTSVACGEDPSESVDNKASQSRKQGHERRRLPARAMAKTREITGVGAEYSAVWVDQAKRGRTWPAVSPIL